MNGRALLVATLVIALGMTTTLHAYLDPGVGASLGQVVFAAIGAVVATTALYWRSTRDAVRRLLTRKANTGARQR